MNFATLLYVDLGIIQATQCKVIHASTVYCVVCNLQPVYWSTWLTHEFRHLIVLKLLSVITRNHSTNNDCCCFSSSVRLQMRTVLSIDEMILGLSWEFDTLIENNKKFLYMGVFLDIKFFSTRRTSIFIKIFSFTISIEYAPTWWTDLNPFQIIYLLSFLDIISW